MFSQVHLTPFYSSLKLPYIWVDARKTHSNHINHSDQILSMRFISMVYSVFSIQHYIVSYIFNIKHGEADKLCFSPCYSKWRKSSLHSFCIFTLGWIQITLLLSLYLNPDPVSVLARSIWKKCIGRRAVAIVPSASLNPWGQIFVCTMLWQAIHHIIVRLHLR